MDELREKMTELIRNAHKKCKANITCSACPRYGHGSDCVYLLMADYLIANGVTVADGKDTDAPTKWIPVGEPPKEPGEYIVAQKHWSDGHLETKKGKWNGVEWLVDGRESLMVTHWMPPSPLPEPPKGE